MTDGNDRTDDSSAENRPLPRALAAWVLGIDRHAGTVLALTAVLLAGLVAYTVTHIGVNTDTAQMLSPDLPWQQTRLEYKEAFPQFDDNLVIVVQGDTPELAERGRERLLQALEERGRHIESMYLPDGGAFMERHGLLYLSEDELDELATQLIRAQPFLGRLAEEPSLAAFADLLARVADAEDDAIQADQLVPILEGVDESFAAVARDEFHRMSWRTMLMEDQAAAVSPFRFISVNPEQNFEALLPAETAINAIHSAIRDAGLDRHPGIRVQLTGSVALVHDELTTVISGSAVIAAMALILVTLVLYFGLRSVWLMLAALGTLLAGLIATAAFAAAAVGELNLISMTFAVLYIGLGIDFAIHFALRYREALAQCDHREALAITARDVGGSLVLCAITTSAGFYAFFPTAFAGVAELGLISGTGMLINLIVTLTLMPALIARLPLAPAGSLHPAPRLRRGLDGILRHGYIVQLSAVVLAVGSLALLPGVRFNADPMDLRDPESESVSAFLTLLEDAEQPPVSASVMTSDLQTAQRRANQLAELDSVDSTRTLADLVPDAQQTKLAILQDLSLVLGPTLQDPSPVPDDPPPPQVLDDLAATLDELAQHPDDALASAAGSLRARVAELQAQLPDRSPAERQHLLKDLELSVMDTLPDTLATLGEGLTAGPIGLDDLPDELERLWRSADGRYRVAAYPAGDITDPAVKERFVRQVTSVAPDATGSLIITQRAGEVVVSAFRDAFIYAAVFVTVVLLVVLRSPGDTLRVLVPLALACALTAAATVVVGIPFNFANVIALPLLLGVGVDNGIHMIHRARFAPPQHGNLLATGTARAVLLSALTTVFSFGNLAFSPHPGTASMGQVLTIGILVALACTLILLPTTIPRRRRA